MPAASALKKYNKKVPIDLIAYDDQGKPDELLKLTERLIQQDKVDMVLSPYASHMNLASAPIINKSEYPVIMTTATTNKTYDLGPRWPYAFWNIAQPKASSGALSKALADLKKQGKIKGRVATVHPTVEYGVENNEAFLACGKDRRDRSCIHQELPVWRLGLAAADPRGDGD